MYVLESGNAIVVFGFVIFGLTCIPIPESMSGVCALICVLYQHGHPFEPNLNDTVLVLQLSCKPAAYTHEDRGCVVAYPTCLWAVAFLKTFSILFHTCQLCRFRVGTHDVQLYFPHGSWSMISPTNLSFFYSEVNGLHCVTCRGSFLWRGCDCLLGRAVSTAIQR